MTPRQPPAPGTRILAVLVLALTVLAVTATASPAHSRVLSTTPGAGSVQTSPPERIDVVFNSDVLPRGASIRLTDPSGREVPLGQVEVSGPRIGASVPALSATGGYLVEYRVVTADAHPVSASYRFSLAATVGMSTRDWVVGILQGAAVAAFVLGAFVWIRRSTRRRRAG